MSHKCHPGYCFGEQLPQRKSLRLPSYDYSRPGFYFVTICTKYHTHWFGEVTNNEIVVNAAGTILQSVWNTLPNRFPGLRLDEFVVMPNHIHGIVVLTKHVCYRHLGTRVLTRPTLGAIICDYKAAATYLIRRSGRSPDFTWQNNFYDVIINSQHMLQEIRFYIRSNPERWISS